MKRIDCHQHFWKLSRGDYTWLTPELETLYRDFLPSDIQSELANANVSETILVQAAPTIAESEYMLSLASSHTFIKGVVAWVDMESADVLTQLSTFMKYPAFKGIRPMIQDIDDVDWLLKPTLTPVFSFLEDNDLSFDALVLPKHLDNLQRLILRHPKLRVVIDHAAKPQIAAALGEDIASSVNRQWAQDIKELAKHENVFCKLSGLLTEAGDNAVYKDLEPYMTHVFRCFGANKLMWGSDWPVVNLTSDYATWFDIASAFIGRLTSSEQQSIWSGAANEFYRLQPKK